MHLTIARMLSCTLLAGATLCAPVFACCALAQEGARIVLSPSPASVGEGTTTAVEVRVENVQDLYGLDIRISFDPAVVEVVDADPGKSGIQVRAGGLLSVDFMIRNVADNTEGTIWYALSQLNPSQPVSGSGTAFIIVFKGKQRGSTSPLTITHQTLASRTGQTIAATAQNTEIRVVEPALAPPTPTTAPPPPQPTVSMPTPEPTQAQPTAQPTSQPTAQPTSQLTAAPTTTQPAAEPTAPAPTIAADTPIPTATQAATQAFPATRAPEPTPAATATARLAVPTQPAPTSPPATPAPEPQGSEGGPVLRDVLAGVAIVLVFAALAGMAWAIRRGRKAPRQ